MNPISVPLPSLIHRLGGSDVAKLKTLASQHKCELKRVRRSRNWVLQGMWQDVNAFTQAVPGLRLVKETYFLSKVTPVLRATKTETPQEMLMRLLKDQPDLTVAELVDATGCELTEVRRARIESEF